MSDEEQQVELDEASGPIRALRERYKWKKVAAPKAWNPEVEGEQLTGFYGGRTIRDGLYGQYEVIIVHVPMAGAFTLTGTKLVQLMDASGATPGEPVIVRWLGHKETARGYKMKNYEVLVADGECVPADALPELPAQH